MQRSGWLRLGAIYAIGAVGGFAMKSVGAPLPWMIGPIVTTAAIYVSGLSQLPVPVRTRPVGQMVVAAQVGLSFSPAGLTKLITMLPILMGMAVSTMICAFAVSLALARLAGMSPVTALLSTMPTSPVEAAIIAERMGHPPAPVILAQTLRIAFVVVLVPVAIYAIDGWPDRQAPVRAGGIDPAGLAVLIAVAIAGAALFRKLNIANPYFLGALAASAALTASGVTPAPFPPLALAAAQIMLGTWLGATFRRSLFVSAGRLFGALVVSIVMFLALSTVCGALASVFLDLRWENLVLAAAPGGVTEMALTASFLGLDVALVTAFHLVRIFMIVPLVPWFSLLFARLK